MYTKEKLPKALKPLYSDKVMLWLGANVMLEYDINDAKELLSNNKANAIKSLEDVNEQMGKLYTSYLT